ncbi:MAG: hypothetical protein ACO2PN_11835 [Pyrobaculum sp.]
MRRCLPCVYGLRRVTAQTRNCGVRRPYRLRGTTEQRTRAPGARNDSATPATAAASNTPLRRGIV